MAECLFAKGIKLQYNVVWHQHGVVWGDKDVVFVLALPQLLRNLLNFFVLSISKYTYISEEIYIKLIFSSRKGNDYCDLKSRRRKFWSLKRWANLFLCILVVVDNRCIKYYLQLELYYINGKILCNSPVFSHNCLLTFSEDNVGTLRFELCLSLFSMHKKSQF